MAAPQSSSEDCHTSRAIFGRALRFAFAGNPAAAYSHRMLPRGLGLGRMDSIGSVALDRTARTRAAAFVRALVIASGCSIFISQAQQAPKLDSIQTVWFQRGTTNEVSITGDALAAVGELRISGAGVSGSLVVAVMTNLTLEASTGGLTAQAPVNAKTASARLVIDSNALPGPRELRVLGAHGVSNPLAIQISDIVEVQEKKPNNSPTEAQELSLPVGVSGTIDKSATSDWYRFHGKAGQRLLFDVLANRTGSPLDPTLVLTDTAGKELARSEDVHGLDPLLEFTPMVDGDYFLQLHDLRFQGANEYRYHLIAGVLPYVDQVFPFGGRRGTSVDLRLRGRNLEGVERMNLRIASDAPLGRQEIRAHTPRGFSNPLPFEASDLPDFDEREPNNTKDTANVLSLPSAINGRIGDKGDLDTFRIRSDSDQRLTIEVHARSFGSPLDSFLFLSDAQGTLIQQNDDASGPDARIEFDAKKDTEYLVSIRDLTDRGGDSFGYRLVIQPPNKTQDFAVRPTLSRLRVARGGTTAVRCELDRRNGFSGVVRITGRDLPSGVESSTLVIPPEGPQFGWLFIDAGSNAPLGNHGLQVVASTELNGSHVQRPLQFSETPFLTVLPSTAFTLDILTPSIQLEQNSGAQLDVSVLRSPGFLGEIKLIPEELPGLSIGTISLPPGQSRGKVSVSAAFNCELSTRPLLLRGEASIDGQTVVQHASASIPVTVTGVPFYITAMLPGSPFFRTDAVKLSAAALPTNTTSAASTSEFVVKVERRNFTNDIQILLEGLPEGVIATTTHLVGAAKEANIRLQVTDKTVAGTNYTFQVIGTAPFGDRTFRQRTVPVTLTVNARETETAAIEPQTAPPRSK